MLKKNFFLGISYNFCRIILIALTLSRATSHFCTNRAPLERAMSHYCTTGSAVFFTAHLDSYLSRFSVCCSSTTFLVILLCYYIYIFTPVTIAVHKTLPFYPEYLLRCINALRDATNNAYLRVRRLFKKWKGLRSFMY